MLHQKPLASCWSPTALKRPDRLKQCHCLQFAKCVASLSHYYEKNLFPKLHKVILTAKFPVKNFIHNLSTGESIKTKVWRQSEEKNSLVNNLDCFAQRQISEQINSKKFRQEAYTPRLRFVTYKSAPVIIKTTF